MDSSIPKHSHNSKSDSDSDSGSHQSFPKSQYEHGSTSRPSPHSDPSSPDSGPPPLGFKGGFDNPPSPPRGGGKRKKEKEIRNETTDQESLPPRKRKALMKKREFIHNMMKQEIHLLNDLILFRNKYGNHPYKNRSNMRKFHQNWSKRREMFVDKATLRAKIIDLHERFVRNYRKRLIAGNHNIEKWMDHSEVRVYQLSNRLWGKGHEDRGNSSETTVSDSERTISHVHSTDESSSTD